MALQRVCAILSVYMAADNFLQLQIQGIGYPLLVSASTVCTRCTGLYGGPTYIHKIKANKSLKNSESSIDFTAEPDQPSRVLSKTKSNLKWGYSPYTVV